MINPNNPNYPNDAKDNLLREMLVQEMDRIAVPPVDEAWSRFVERYDNGKRNFRYSKLAWAVAVLLIITTTIMYQPAPTVAFGEKFIRTIKDFFVGETVKNRQITYSEANQPQQQPPVVKNLGSITEKEVTFEEAQKTVPFQIATPSYLPTGAILKRVLLMLQNPRLAHLRLEYEWQQKILSISEQNIVGQMSMGMMYDTDDTKIKDIEINGSKEQLFMYKDGSFSLIWSIRDLNLELRSDFPETEVVKIVNSLK